MICLKNTAKAPELQAQIIIPYNYFVKPYIALLNSIDGILTPTERKVLSFLAFRGYKDGKIFPKRENIAKKINRCPDQVTRVIKSLVEKGFLWVERSSTVERHVFRKSNRYHFLNHPIYDEFEKTPIPPDPIPPDKTRLHSIRDRFDQIRSRLVRSRLIRSAPMSYETSGDPTYLYREIFKKEHREKGVFLKGKKAFDPDKFRAVHLARGVHPLAIDEAIRGVLIGKDIRHPYSYGFHIINIQSGNYYAADAEVAHKVIKEKERGPVANFLAMVGLSPPTKEKKVTKEELIAKARRSTEKQRMTEMIQDSGFGFLLNS